MDGKKDQVCKRNKREKIERNRERRKRSLCSVNKGAEINNECAEEKTGFKEGKKMGLRKKREEEEKEDPSSINR